MNITWLSDIHLDHPDLTAESYAKLITQIRKEASDAVLITGDIGTSSSVMEYLEQLGKTFPIPIYFVLGNHDFFKGWMASVKYAAKELKTYVPNLIYLSSQTQPIELTPDTCLIGHDGWADGRLGTYGPESTTKDYDLINDFGRLGKKGRLEKMHQLGDEAAVHIRALLALALKNYRNVILATHFPQFEQSCRLEANTPADQSWLPHLACKAVGDIITELMADAPEAELTVYCGHTHAPTTYQPLPNVTVHTASAEYGSPQLQKLITI